MRFVSLFAGIGGMDLGLERAGWTCVAQVEIDEFCRSVLARHWPDVPRFGDVREVHAGDFGPVDAVVGGPPCQPASVAGKRQGSADERWLWGEFLRVCRELRPRWIVAENPLGIVSLRPHGLEWIAEELEREGYEVLPVVVGADDVGAPHRRKRVFIVAHREIEGRERGGIGSGTEATGAVLHEHALDGDLADADAALRDEPGRIGPERPEGMEPQREGEAEPGGGDPLEHAAGSRCATDARRSLDAGIEPQPGRVGVSNPDGEPPDGSPVARQECCNGSSESRLGGNLDGLSARLDRWPAPPGPQKDWEPPRTVERGTPGRRPRLKALGNAVVPQVAEAIGRAINEATR